MDIWTETNAKGLRIALPMARVGDAYVGCNGDDEPTNPDWYGLVIQGDEDVAVMEGTLRELAREMGAALRVVNDLVVAEERATRGGKRYDAQTVTLLVPDGRRYRLLLPDGVSA